MRFHTKFRRERRGLALLWSVFAILVVTVSTYISFMLSNSANELAETNWNGISAQKLSEAATEQAMLVIQESLEGGLEVPVEGTLDLGDLSARFTIAERGATSTETDPTTSLQANVQYYDVSCTAEVGDTRHTTRRIARASMISAFQFAIFMETDLVVYNQAATRINGPVHVNGDMYVHTRRDLTFDTNYVGVAGEIKLERVFNSWTDYSGQLIDPMVRRWVEDPFDASEIDQWARLEYGSEWEGWDSNGDGDFEDWGESLPFAPWAMETFSEPDFYAGDGEGFTVKTADHGIGRLELPTIDDLAMFGENEDGGDWEWDESQDRFVEVAEGEGTHDKNMYHAEADLSIITFENGSWIAYDADGNDVSDALEDAVDDKDIYDAYQARDGGNVNKKIQNTIIDMEELGDSGVFPANGLLYLASYGAGTGLDAKGFQLTNGEEIDDDLMVVSPNSIYLHGDYNVSDKKNCAVVADAVHVLSNSWDGTKKYGDQPRASDTTYNVSVVTGALPQGADNDTGQFVVGNLLRRHEDWLNKDENFNGSLISLGYSKYATARPHITFYWYHDPSGYKPPFRNWSFDTALRDMDNQPPFAPRLVIVTDACIW